jgi:hypothetical protein
VTVAGLADLELGPGAYAGRLWSAVAGLLVPTVGFGLVACRELRRVATPAAAGTDHAMIGASRD